jgi:hypothetical protein
MWSRQQQKNFSIEENLQNLFPNCLKKELRAILNFAPGWSSGVNLAPLVKFVP